MARRRLQQRGNLYQQGGWWKLRWREDRLEATGAVSRGWSRPVVVGPARGNPARMAPLTETEARRLAWDNWLSRLDENQRTPKSIMTVRQFVEGRYIAGHVKHLKDRENYESRIDRYILPALGDLRMRDVRRQHIQQMCAAVIAQGKSVQLARHLRNLASGIFRYAASEECFTGPNPAQYVKLPEMTRQERHALTGDQVQVVLHEMPERYRPLVLMAVLTSLTISEMLGLRWRYVNLTDDWTTVGGESIAPLSFHARYSWRGGKWQTLKAAPRRRNIPLPVELALALLEMRERSRFQAPDDPVFAARNGRPLDGHNVLNRYLKPIGRAHGMPWLNWHCLRHTTATWADRVGMSAADRMALGGWSQARTMMSYTHADLERRREALERMAAGIGGVQ